MLKSSQYTQICKKQGYKNFSIFCKISLKLSNVGNSQVSQPLIHDFFHDLTSQISCPIIQLKSPIQLGICYLSNPKYPIVSNPKFSHNFKINPLNDLHNSKYSNNKSIKMVFNGQRSIQFYLETWRGSNLGESI